MGLNQVLIAQSLIVPKLYKMRPLNCPGKETKQTKKT